MGLSLELGGGTQGPGYEVKDKVKNQQMNAQITTGVIGQGLITDYWGEGIKARTDPAAGTVVELDKKSSDPNFES